MPIVKTSGIHNGLRTQYQAQLIYPVNFNATNNIVNNPKKEIEFDDVFFILFC